MLLNHSIWEKFVRGFDIVGGTLTKNGFFAFILSENTGSPHNDPTPSTRFLIVSASQPMDKRCFLKECDFFQTSSIGTWEENGAKEFVSVDSDGRTMYYRGKEQGWEQKGINIRWLNDARGAAINKVKRVNGNLYAIAYDRFIWRRLGVEKWEEMSGIGRPKERQEKACFVSNFGFRDLSAFSPNDMYAVGGRGDVWHFNGKTWRQIDFPSNESLYTVCCAGDGQVYISGYEGSLWGGRDDTWKRLADGEFTLPFKDSAWFAGRMWFGMDYGLYELKDGQLESVAFPEETFGRGVMSGCIDISLDGLHMLTAGICGAAIFDGETWEPLWNTSFFDPTFDQPDEETDDEDEDA